MGNVQKKERDHGGSQAATGILSFQTIVCFKVTYQRDCKV